MYPGTHAATAPDRPAVIMVGSDRTVSYAELEDNSARLAAALHQLGLRTGDVVAVLSDNVPEAFEIYWAAIRSGLYVTFVNWHRSAAEATYIVRSPICRTSNSVPIRMGGPAVSTFCSESVFMKSKSRGGLPTPEN